MVDKLESLIEGKADSDVSSYAIAGRSLNKLTPDELITWYNFYKSKYQQEVKEFRIGRNEGSGAVVKVRFDDIS